MMTQAQIAQLKRSIKISELTEEELKGCPEETRMYRSIGRMWVHVEVVVHKMADKECSILARESFLMWLYCISLVGIAE